MKVFTLEKKDGSYIRQKKEIPDEDILESIQAITGATWVQVMPFTYKGEEYDVWYDDEFLLKEQPTATLILGNLKPGEFVLLCGNLFFAKHDKEGNTIGLSSKDISNLWEFTDINGIRLTMAFKKGLLKTA